ncbi:MAG: EAL domain-containing protein [Pseudomonadales bacterium]|nr:EAL domain-containing protein [Pseudomonadales bacterium]
MTDRLTRVLAVDDKIANLRALRVSLESLEIDFVEVTSGEEALNQVLNDSFSVILMDVNMPGMDGIETAELIANYQADNVTPIIFLTAVDQPENAAKSYSAGAVDYLTKPFDPDILVAKVKIFIELYKQQERVQLSLANANLMREQSELLMESAGQGLIGINDDYKITFVNAMACTLLTTEKLALIGQSIKPFVFGDNNNNNDDSWEESPIYTAIHESHNVHIDDAIFWNGQQGKLPVDYTLGTIQRQGTLAGAVLLFQDITERKLSADKMAHLAQYDQLTGIYNRRMFQTLLGESVSHAKRFDSQLALHFIDLDRFKDVNDTLGHDAGDALLKEAVQRINALIRDVDILCRLGGDEFGIIQRIDDSSGFSAASMAQRIIDAFEPGFVFTTQTMQVGCSIGLAQYPAHGDTVDSLVKAADTAMYNAKASGRNQYQFYSDELQQKLSKEMSLVAALKKAIQHQQLHLFYQPQIDANTLTLIGVEALARWTHSTLGPVDPKVFVPLAEKIGLINKLGEWCLTEAVGQAVKWNRTTGLAVSMSVNISVHQFVAEGFVELVEKVVSEANLDPRLLNLEITESVLMENPEYCISKIHQLKALGIHTSIDDFGTGYSSLSYLGKLPVKSLKIDEAFITDIQHHVEHQTIVKLILGLARGLHYDVIAEGVETKEELDFLIAAGCHYIQGFYYSQPLSANDLEVTFLDEMVLSGKNDCLGIAPKDQQRLN